jgi:hypothetical protein
MRIHVGKGFRYFWPALLQYALQRNLASTSRSAQIAVLAACSVVKYYTPLRDFFEDAQPISA